MDEKTTKDNVTPDEKIKLDVEKILNDYSLEELKEASCESFLLGNFDKDKKYKILDIMYPELINLKKVLQKNTNESYIAVAVVNNLKLNFEVKFEKNAENKMTATLILNEKLVIGGIYESTLSTTLKTINGDDCVEFLNEVRSAFHIVIRDEDDQQDLLENYVSPPIELSGELLRKNEMLDVYKLLWKDFEKDYINDLFNVLKKSKGGQEIIKKFLITLKQYDFSTIKQEKNHIMKAIFDKILDEEIKNKTLEKEQFLKIVEIRQSFAEKIDENLKEKLKEQIAMLKPENLKPIEKPKIEVKPQPKPAQSKGSSSQKSSSSGSPPKSASSPKKDESSPKKEEKKPLFVTGVKVPPIKLDEPKPEQKKKPLKVEQKPEIERVGLGEIYGLSESVLRRSQDAEKIGEKEGKRALTASKIEEELNK